MAITVVTDGVSAAITLANATAFSVEAGTTLLAEDFAVGENAIVYILMPSGAYKPLTNKDGTVILTAEPNVCVLDAAGTYKVTKDLTAADAYIGHGA